MFEGYGILYINEESEKISKNQNIANFNYQDMSSLENKYKKYEG